jgi:hypothetical protein
VTAGTRTRTLYRKPRTAPATTQTIAISSAIPPPAGMPRTPVATFERHSLTNRPVRGHSRPFAGQYQDFPELTVRWPTLGQRVPVTPAMHNPGLCVPMALRPRPTALPETPVRSRHSAAPGWITTAASLHCDATYFAAPGAKIVVHRPRSGHFCESAAVISSWTAGASGAAPCVELAARFYLSWTDSPRRPVRWPGSHCCLPSVRSPKEIRTATACCSSDPSPACSPVHG